MKAKTVITLKNINGQPKTGAVVNVYAGLETSPYYGALVGQATEIPGKGQYYIENNGCGFYGTVLVNGVRDEANTNIWFDGLIPAGKTDFAY